MFLCSGPVKAILNHVIDDEDDDDDDEEADEEAEEEAEEEDTRSVHLQQLQISAARHRNTRRQGPRPQHISHSTSLARVYVVFRGS